jgi:hypothetical protein
VIGIDDFNGHASPSRMRLVQICLISSSHVPSIPPKYTRHRGPHSRVVLFLQVCDHAGSKEESCADEHLHPESKKEGMFRVIRVQCTASEAPAQVRGDEEYAAVTCMIGPRENAWVAEGGDLTIVVSMYVVRERSVEMR